MEKKAKPAASARAPKKGKPRGGRPKEKVQVSVRIDRMVMDLVRAYLDRNKKEHITDLLERGALLALREAEKLARISPEYANARIALNDVGVELARDVTDMWAWRYLAEHRALMALEECLREFHLKTLKSVREREGYAEALRMIVDPNVMLGDRNQIMHGMSKPSSTP